MAPNYLAFLLFFLPLASATSICPPTGPVLPTPRIVTPYDLSSLSQKLNLLLNNTQGQWSPRTNSFSIEITSAQETFFQFHHTAPVRSNKGVSKVDTNTVYRVASVTKVFNVLSLLLVAPDALDKQISDYVPELRGSSHFEGITLRMLGSQLSGLLRDGTAFDWYTDSGDALQEAGFPVPNPDDIPKCDTVKDPPCTNQELFGLLRTQNLTWLPADRAAYSNHAYSLISIALENMTNKPFEQILQEYIMKPLDLNSTSLEIPEMSRGIIPQGLGEIIFSLNTGSYKPTAGLYSTPGNLSAFLRSILNNSLLSPIKTREWLKPSAFGGSSSAAVGMPWEIMRLRKLTKDNRVIDVYTKSGGIFAYDSYIVLLPDYNVGATILVSGDSSTSTMETILDLVIESTVSSLDSLAREQAESRYSGFYADTCGARPDNNTSPQASISLSVDDGPGLKIIEWKNNGKSVLSVLASRRGRKETEIDARLYPVGADNKWRMGVETSGSKEELASLPSKACNSWMLVDSMRYAGLPVDEFAFIIEDEGEVKGINNKGLRANLRKCG